MDKISVIIRNKNEERYIGYAIQSVLNVFNKFEINESIFEAEITGELGKATERVLDAFNQVNKNLSPENPLKDGLEPTVPKEFIPIFG